MLPATITLKGIWAAVIALAFAILLVLLGVQTVRIEGFKIWPISVEGWKPKAERLQHDLDNVKAAQGIALQKAQAAKTATEKKYADLAETTDANEQKARVQAMDDVQHYAATHRLRIPTITSPGSNSVTATNDHGSGLPQEMPADSVILAESDLRTCGLDAAYALEAHKWAIGLAGAVKDRGSNGSAVSSPPVP